MKHLLALLLIMSSTATVLARSHYATIHNHFASLTARLHETVGNHVHYYYEAERLVIANGNARALILCDTTLVPEQGYEYMVRAASKTNHAGRSYSISDAQGRKSRVSTTAWGIVFDWRDSLNYRRVELSCDNSNLYDDLTDKRQMHVSVYRCVAGDETMSDSWELSRGVDLDDGLNTLSVSVHDNKVHVSVGKHELQSVGAIPLDLGDPCTTLSGIYLSPGAEIAVERTVLNADSNPPRRIATTWTRESLDQHFSLSDDPIEGYWQYQDRDMEDRWLRLGGRYTVAVVAADKGYDIVYVSGAQVNAPQWCEGLLKGHISKTIFDGHYDLEWIDATFEPITQDAYAAFENGVLMTLNFPVYKSSLRLSKVLAGDD